MWNNVLGKAKGAGWNKVQEDEGVTRGSCAVFAVVKGAEQHERADVNVRHVACRTGHGLQGNHDSSFAGRRGNA